MLNCEEVIVMVIEGEKEEEKCKCKALDHATALAAGVRLPNPC